MHKKKTHEKKTHKKKCIKKKDACKNDLGHAVAPLRTQLERYFSTTLMCQIAARCWANKKTGKFYHVLSRKFFLPRFKNVIKLPFTTFY